MKICTSCSFGLDYALGLILVWLTHRCSNTANRKITIWHKLVVKYYKKKKSEEKLCWQLFWLLCHSPIGFVIAFLCESQNMNWTLFWAAPCRHSLSPRYFSLNFVPISSRYLVCCCVLFSLKSFSLISCLRLNNNWIRVLVVLGPTVWIDPVFENQYMSDPKPILSRSDSCGK